jgi:hypothetical protein
MRISERTIVALMMGTALLAAPALAFDCTPINQPALSMQPAPSITSKKPVPPASVPESAASSLSALQNAAEDGHPIAQWKLGRMYAEGNGVAQNDLLAFDYFSRIANAHANDTPSAPQAQIVANAFVALGRYYLTGIPNSKITSDPERAREMFYCAASYFGNADAQYDLARLYLKKMPDHMDECRKLLGRMLFDGDRLPPRRARGLVWLTLACECAGPEESCRKLLMPDKPDIPKHMDDIPQRWFDLPAGISDSPRG